MPSVHVPFVPQDNVLSTFTGLPNLLLGLRAELILILLLIAGYLGSIISVHVLGLRVPLFGVAIFEPRLVGSWRFFKHAGKIIDEGYASSQTKAFRLVRNDTDIVVLPRSTVEEISALPREVANPTLAHTHNLLGQYTGIDLISKSDLHFRMIQGKLTPVLGALTASMEEEIKWATPQAIPGCEDEWIRIKPYHSILKLVSSISARIFVGLPLCRDQRWLDTSVRFTENVFNTIVIMRLFPSWTHGILAWLIPSNYRSARNIEETKKLFVPEIERRKALLSQGKLDEKVANTLLSWMIEAAQGAEQDSQKLAQLEVVISLAAIHTSQLTTVHTLYDLASRPQFIEELRDEIREVVAAKGGVWDKASYAQLRKMDSFMKESQRFNPTSVLAYHRVMERDYTMKDGTYLPRGTHIAFPVQAIQNDPAVTEDPEMFDGLRYYRLRQEPGAVHRHQFATTEKAQLHFGYGRTACPGRFFSSLEIKMILVHFIMNYDFKLVGEKRPENLTAHDFIFPHPEGELWVRQRKNPESPF